AAGRGDRRRHEGRALLVGPHFLHGPHIERRVLSDVALRARQFVEAAPGATAAAAAFLLLDALRADLDAALAERDDQLVRALVIAGRRPVMAPLGARTSLKPLAESLLEDVGSVGRPSGLRVEPLPHVLEYRFLVAQVFAGLPIELPQDAVLPDSE